MLHNSLFTLIFIFSIQFVSAQTANYLTNYAEPGALEVSLEPGYLQNSYYTNSYQYDSYSVEFLNESMEAAKDRHPLEKTGRVLTYVGVPLTIIGAVMVAGADELYYNCYNGDCEGDPQGGVGILALVSGLGLTGTGVTLWIIGSKK